MNPKGEMGNQNSFSDNKKYNQFSRHLKELFGQKVYKVTLDAGFSCPNRDGKISKIGCIFCDDSGSFSQAHDHLLPIKNQLETGIETLSGRFGAKKFISYFQAYSNTYAPVKVLESTYAQALGHKDVVGLSIGTRPDCVDKDKINLISDIAKDHYTWVEYGLQSIHDKTLDFINRGHHAREFYDAVELTQGKNINICAHVIIGLPNESKDDILQTAKEISRLGIDGVKIHLLCILKGTPMERMYNNGEIRMFEEDEYIETVCDFLELLPPEMTIHRLAGNGLKKILVAPRWLPKKFELLNKIDTELDRRGSYQGKFVQK
ncbi:MAG: TIGR01212 family radical SAM protein [Candidatus Gastranaerophilales bacterium]|nr:TIGR01212 family radical SAM protein [Candidatus Gastranaerophilales bacterium]